jgi:hypothetical protein
MPRARFLLALLVMPLLPAPLDAQRNCNITRTGEANLVNPGTPFEVMYMGGGVQVRCAGGTTIRSDSAVYMGQSGMYEFIRNVQYADSARTLTARHMLYHEPQRLVTAENDVVLTDILNGSTLRGPSLSYYLKSETQPEDMLQMHTGRPVAMLIRPAAADTMMRDTTIVVADMLDIVGETRFSARGNVDVTRSNLKAYAASAEFTEDAGDMTLRGNARIVDEEYTVHGDSIVGASDEEGELREVRALGNARIDAEEMDVQAPVITVFLAESQLDRLVAVGTRNETAPERSVQARALSPELRLLADSLDIRAPGRQVEQVVAIGHGFAERLTTDTTAAERPEMPRNDWVRGDTIIARFTDPPPSATDTTQQRVLEHLDVRAGTEKARSFYLIPDENDPNGQPAVNYVIAQRIQVSFRDGQVVAVEADDADGQLHGMYLRPLRGGGGTGGGR